MKKLILLFAINFLSLSFLSQIDDVLLDEKWKVGQTKEIYGNKILRLEGENGGNGITNIGYQTFDFILTDIANKADNEMWTEEKKQKTIKAYTSLASGGQINLYITRLSIGAGNLKWFTVILKDSAQKEIFREELKEDSPEVPIRGTDYWWNFLSINLAGIPKGAFDVYIIDKIGGDTPRYKFQVKP